jgi:hypothetical protein
LAELKKVNCGLFILEFEVNLLYKTAVSIGGKIFE